MTNEMSVPHRNRSEIKKTETKTKILNKTPQNKPHKLICGLNIF